MSSQPSDSEKLYTMAYCKSSLDGLRSDCTTGQSGSKGDPIYCASDLVTTKTGHDNNEQTFDITPPGSHLQLNCCFPPSPPSSAGKPPCEEEIATTSPAPSGPLPEQSVSHQLVDLVNTLSDSAKNTVFPRGAFEQALSALQSAS